MRQLLVYLKDYKKESVLGPLFKLLEASFELLVPLVVAQIIDVGIAGEDKRYVSYMCLIMVALGIVGLISSLTAQYFAAKAAVGFGTKLRHALFSKMQSLSFSEIDTIGTSTMITRITSDLNQVQSAVNLVLRLFLRSPFIVFGAMIMAFTIDSKAALVFLVMIVLLSIVIFGIMSISIPLYKKVQEALERVLTVTRENLTGARVIRAFRNENEETEKFEENNALLASMQKYVGKISALMNPITYMIVNGAVIALVWVGAIRVNSGYITQGEVVALYNYMLQILVELIKLANLIVTITKALACANRIQSVFEVENEEKLFPGTNSQGANSVVANPAAINSIAKNVMRTEVTSPAAEPEYVVEFNHVSLTYKNAGAESLTDIDFRVRPGETIGIIGGTGSGKTSLVHLIPRFYDATKGEVKINGVDVKDYEASVLKEKVGIVMQKAVLFRGTIRENLQWGKKDATEEELQLALEIAQAKDIVEAKEDGLEEYVSQSGKNLSGGQRQRLTIARALVRKPEILILDDSASALDFATEAALRKAIREKADARAVFIVSQRASSIRYADQIIVLDDGEMVGKGTHDTLLETCPVYEEIYYSQFERKGENIGQEQAAGEAEDLKPAPDGSGR